MLFLLVACTPGAPCPDGTTRREDGLCYAEAEPSGPTADEVVAALPACTLGEGNGRLDLDGNCLDGACAGDSYAEMNAGVGEVGSYDGGALWSDGNPQPFAFVEWSPGFWSLFPAIEEPDYPYDFVPVSDAATGWQIQTYDGYTGTTAEGLGVESELSCWIETLGEPTLDYVWEDGERLISRAWWGEGPDVMLMYTEDVRLLAVWPR